MAYHNLLVFLIRADFVLRLGVQAFKKKKKAGGTVVVGVYLALEAVGVSTALLRVPWLWKKDSQRNVADSIARTLRQTAGDTSLRFSLSVYFPPKREQWIPQLQNTKLGRPHLPPSPPSTSSARKIVLAHSQTCSSLLCSCHFWCNSPCYTAPLLSSPPTFGCMNKWGLECPVMCFRGAFLWLWMSRL